MTSQTDELPWGFRSPVDEPLFARPGADDSIVPDRISPTIEGYFRVPAIWAGAKPEPDPLYFDERVHHTFVLNTKLKSGIETWVRRDGVFLFDFATWPLAPTVRIPGYRSPAPHHRIPLFHSRAEEEAESHAIIRAKVMNVHQVCLTTSEHVVKRRSSSMGFPVTAWNSFKAIHPSSVTAYYEDTEDTVATHHIFMNNTKRVSRDRSPARRVIELDVIAHSFQLLDDILSRSDITLIHQADGAYQAACRLRDKRFGEASILAWSVCEQMVMREWKKTLDILGQAYEGRINKDRRKKLSGRDYTASVVVEILESHGRIDKDLYRLLEISRKARNEWAHNMREPTQRDARVAISAVERLFAQTHGLPIKLGTSSRGGVPQWPIWMRSDLILK